ncbi:TPA: ParB N-terminal domain-containing protein [Escherichia coli]|uniref:ParB/Srx family N-terminal domain-containing protein n=1 Tax=Escherichia coli TaxID=562 RepID=UPI002875B0BB|nr:ParB/Srx family N-terminal domain-containing protein [Escherichia coli]MDS1159615.1 ParB/Srx family N-terminal domain-containing protein [Escherichia coli]HCJ8564084.1 ParB N-terminal domain-containing protein [Escherichia coli]HCJ8699268.1 ParB N-terminal domain-containing protein [Escherichia coli]HCJ9385700.1 ParB N-terminal domain-containing protein [Escherichia coli]HCJ9421227.1 ParB N-terminal domain-containing protein [Escherichia coli]
MTKKFEIVYRDPADLIPYEMNAKKHDEQQIRDLAAAIKKRGFDQPITVDKNDVIITGHGRREAAIFAGLERVPVIVRDDLSDDEVRAKRLEDNRLASIDYDAIKLQKELESLVLDDIEVFGFEERELNVLVGSMTEEMDTDSLVIDLGEETKRQKDEHTEISREVAAEEVRVVDVLGFKTLPAGSAIVVGDLLAHMEEMTEESGVDAFVAYAEKISSGEMAA